ncbi:MAG: hypothetical protein LUH11_03660 [Candidatus Gastranaerophilales bacterium]|nr:hypothetical protein [Candidatus Gastranaerophilales bacterium]
MIKINNQYHTSFSGINKDKRTLMLSKEEQMPILIEKGAGVLNEKAQLQVPENGKFNRIFVAFNIPETPNEAVFTIEHDELNPKNSRRLSIGVHHNNMDRLFSNYVLKGTKQEILDYLKNKDNYKDILEIVNNLSEKTDEYYSSL